MQVLGAYGVSATSGAGGSSVYDGPWDARMVHGCHCGGGALSYVGPKRHHWVQVEGWRCSHKHCPAGEDPKALVKSTWGTLGHEVQTITCTGAAGDGFVRIGFRNSTTPWLDADAPTSDAHTVQGGSTLSVQAALNALPPLFGVSVSSDDGTLCAVGGATSTVTFLGLHGANPGLLTVEGNGTLSGLAVVRASQGTLNSYECNRRGACNHATGRCTCLPGYGSSNGNGTAGDKGDCGHLDADYSSPHLSSATRDTRGASIGGLQTWQDLDTHSVDSILEAYEAGSVSDADALQALSVLFASLG